MNTAAIFLKIFQDYHTRHLCTGKVRYFVVGTHRAKNFRSPMSVHYIFLLYSLDKPVPAILSAVSSVRRNDDVTTGVSPLSVRDRNLKYFTQ